MTYDKEDRLEQYLSRSADIPARIGLESRILRASLNTQTPPSFFNWLSQSFEELMLPRPVYAFSLALFLGFTLSLGLQFLDKTEAQSSELKYVQSFLSMESAL